MKKLTKAILTISLVFVTIISLTACNLNTASIFDFTGDNELNKTATEKEWSEQGVNEKESKIAITNNYSEYSLYDAYTDLVEKENFTGSFSDFLKEYITNNNDISTNIEYAVNKNLLSAVSIFCVFNYETTNADIFGNLTKEYNHSLSAGAGVIYTLNKQSGDAYIITNYHVVYSSDFNRVGDKIVCYQYGYPVNYYKSIYEDKTSEVVFNDYAIECEFVGGSYTYDLAVLKVTNSNLLKNNDATAVTCTPSHNISVGSTAIAIGNPSGNGISATSGIISVDSEYIQVGTNQNYMRVMRIDTAVNSGNSGGGLFNINGDLIGIVSAKAGASDIENIGYAIPSDIVTSVANNIIKYCNGTTAVNAIKPTLGITVGAIYSQAVFNEQTLKTNIVETVAIAAISANSLASGKLKQNSVITEIVLQTNNSTETIKVTRSYQVAECTLKLGANDKITFKLTDPAGNKLDDVTITITNSSLSVID